ncbi:general odorant-binding protein 99b-like [Topomyia yanbarensis]|uniref:general odorant-binding protein 99b-like n=1 Tax=Topomyia yanbarensis TaxID=2498891 RepID=UPI00273AFF09|nr:general odorant-binding protein 99b-like [Topomyia yanbarensis]
MINLVQITKLLVISGLLLTAPIQANEKLNRLIEVCSTGLDVSQDQIKRYRKVDFPDDTATKCMLRCIGLNLGVYDDLSGVHMHDTWLMFREGRNDSDERAFADQHYRCIGGQLARVPENDYCGRVYAVYQCYKDEFETLMRKLGNSSG